MTHPSNFKDLFSGHAQDYALFRPRYPQELFAYLAELPRSRDVSKDRVWDCGTGNGQAAAALAEHFPQVVATDPSAEQLKNATPHPRVLYKVGTAEASGLDAASVSLVTVAQALHWFRFQEFFKEVRRVCPQGHLAVWSYGLAQVQPDIDAAVLNFYQGEIDRFWEPERRHVDHGYRDIEFPFAEVSAPAFRMRAEWSVDQCIGYLGTWSAVKKARRELTHDPLLPLAERLRALWPAAEKKLIRWPLALRVFQVS